MRVLFTTTPGCGYFFPMVPLAWSLRCAGHQVVFASPRPLAKAVRAAGLEHVPVGDNTTGLDLWPEQSAPADSRDFTGEPWVRLAEQTVAETIDLAGKWRPNLIVSEYAEFAGPIASALFGIPALSHHWGLHLSDRLAGHLFDEKTLHRLHTLQEHFGLLPEETTPTAELDLCPPSLLCFDNTKALMMRHIPYGGAGIPSPWLWGHRTRPRVCVSMGSVPLDAGMNDLRTVAQGLSDFDGEVVLTGAGSRSSALTDLPDNVHTAGWLPHDQVLAACDLVVHQGGSGTAMNSLLFGLPQLVLPHLCDQFENAERLAASGSARSIDFCDRTGRRVRKEVETLLVEPTYREHARRISDEIEAMPAPAEVVSALEAIVKSTSPRRSPYTAPPLLSTP